MMWTISLRSDAGIMLTNPPHDRESRYQSDTWLITSPKLARILARELQKVAKAWETSKPYLHTEI